ncbi:MAG TPA: hypothetical protein PK735_14745, partial [Flavobacteriales bacterium]|nr:hypothetical protein [Flavobacteriales bacterium]
DKLELLLFQIHTSKFMAFGSSKVKGPYSLSLWLNSGIVQIIPNLRQGGHANYQLGLGFLNALALTP